MPREDGEMGPIGAEQYSLYERDDDLRIAHQVAFERIRAARSDPDYQRLVSEAVAGLVEACEAYVWSRDHHGGAAA